MDDRSTALHRYAALDPQGEIEDGAVFNVRHDKLNIELADYIRVLARRPFARDLMVSWNKKTAAGQLRRWLPKIKGREKQAANLVQIINDAIHAAPVDGPKADFLVRVELAEGPVDASTLPEPREATTILSFDTVRDIVNRCTVEPAAEPPPLNSLSIPAGLMVISQRVSHVTSRGIDNFPVFFQGGGPDLYGERNRDPLIVNDPGNIGPVGVPWPEYLLTNPQFIPLYHLLYPGDPRVNIGNDEEMRTDAEDQNIITEKDAAAIAAEAAVLAVEARRKAQEHEAEAQGERGREGMRARQEASEHHLEEENEQNAEIKKTENRSIGAEIRRAEASAAAGAAGSAAGIAKQTAAAEAEITAPETPERPESAPVAEGTATTEAITEGRTAEGGVAPQRPLSATGEGTGAAETAAGEAKTATGEIGTGEIAAGAAVAEGIAGNQAEQPSAAQQTQMAGATQAGVPAEFAQGESAEAVGPQQQRDFGANADQTAQQAQIESSTEAGQSQQPQPEEPQQPSETQPQKETESHAPEPDRENRLGTENEHEETSYADQTREENERAASGEERETAREDRAIAADEEEANTNQVAGFTGVDFQSAAAHGGFAAHGMMHAAMHEGMINPETGLAAAYVATPYAATSAPAPVSVAAASAAPASAASVQTPYGTTVATAHLGTPAVAGGTTVALHPPASSATAGTVSSNTHAPLTATPNVAPVAGAKTHDATVIVASLSPALGASFLTVKPQSRGTAAGIARRARRGAAPSKKTGRRKQLLVRDKLRKVKTADNNAKIALKTETAIQPPPTLRDQPKFTKG